MTMDHPPWLENSWYVAALAGAIKVGAMIRVRIAGNNLVLGRSADGALFALHDRCPHRGAPLSDGVLSGDETGPRIACPYHGWQFCVTSGACIKIPALSADDSARENIASIRLQLFPVREQAGLVWVFIGDEAARHGAKHDPAFAPTIALPDIGVPAGLRPRTVTIIDASGPHVEAVTGLVDPAHTPFVHKQWWWRKGKAAEEKQKSYQPLPHGFRIPAHAPSSNSRIYKFLGAKPTTQIDFLLPGVRVETIRVGTKTVIGLTAITPIDQGRNRIFNVLFWDLPLLGLLKPVIDAMALSFLQQDRDILCAQGANIASPPLTPLFVGEVDTPAKWLHQMNRAWREQMVGATPAPFDNRIKVGDLHWKT